MQEERRIYGFLVQFNNLKHVLAEREGVGPLVKKATKNQRVTTNFQKIDDSQ